MGRLPPGARKHVLRGKDCKVGEPGWQRLRCQGNGASVVGHVGMRRLPANAEVQASRRGARVCTRMHTNAYTHTHTSRKCAACLRVVSRPATPPYSRLRTEGACNHVRPPGGAAQRVACSRNVAGGVAGTAAAVDEVVTRAPPPTDAPSRSHTRAKDPHATQPARMCRVQRAGLGLPAQRSAARGGEERTGQ